MRYTWVLIFKINENMKGKIEMYYEILQVLYKYYFYGIP